jgi:hypothetical protein
LQSPAGDIPMVHIPFGIANKNLISWNQPGIFCWNEVQME